MPLQSTLTGLGGPQLQGLAGLRAPLIQATKYAYEPGEQSRDQPVGAPKVRKQTADETDYLDHLMSAGAELVDQSLSALGYLGTSVFDAILGRRVRAGLAILTGQGDDKNRVGELFTIPVISDLVGWTDPQSQVTGKDLLGGWDSDDTILDGIAGFAVELLTDPLSFAPGMLLGAANKGGRMVRSAGHMNKVTKAASQKLGRKVGPREAMAEMSLREAVVLSNNGLSDLAKMKPKVRAKWDYIAQTQGYNSLDDALLDGANSVLGGRIGLTKNPVGDATKTVTEGLIAGKLLGGKKYLRAVDTASDYLGNSYVGRGLAKAFNPAVRGAATGEVQGRLKEAGGEIDEAAYNIRLESAERHAVLTAAGLDKPQYRQAIRGAIEKAIRRGETPNAETQWQLPSMERDIDEVISNNLKASGDPDWKDPKRHSAYKQIRTYMEQVWDETEENLLRFNKLGLGDKTLDDLWNNYLHRSSRRIPDPDLYNLRVPDHITVDMRRRLKKDAGLDDEAIDKLPVEEAFRKAYGTKIDEATKYKADQLKAGKSSYGVGLPERVVQTSDETQIRRLMELKNVRGGGTNAIAFGSMDSRLSGPLADLAGNASMRQRIVYTEYMQGNDDVRNAVERSARERVMATKAKKEAAKKATPPEATLPPEPVKLSAADEKRLAALESDVEFAKQYAPEGIDAAEEALAKFRKKKKLDKPVQAAPPPADLPPDLVAELDSTEFSPFQADQKWGDMADMPGIDFAAGKRADDLLGDDARRLNDWLEIERRAYDQAHDIAEFLHGLDPRYAFHQIPLFRNDPALDHMDFMLATSRTQAMAVAALKAAADGVDTKLTHRTQGKTVIKALREAHFKGKYDKALKAWFDHNMGEYGQDAALKAQMKKDYPLLFEENPNEMFLKGGDDAAEMADEAEEAVEGVTLQTRTATIENINPDWLAHEMQKSMARMRYGLRPAKKTTEKGTKQKYLRLKAAAEKKLRQTVSGNKKFGPVDTDKMAAVSGSGISLRTKDLIEIARRAKASSIKIRPETLASVINDAAFRIWTKQGNRPFRVRMDVVNDLRKAMDLSNDSAAVRGFFVHWDRLTNLWKGPNTSQFMAYHSRNLQNLGLMDFFWGEGSNGGIREMFSPKRIKRFYQSWKWSKQLHGGETLKGVSKAPFFRGTSFSELRKRLGRDNASDDEIATMYLRNMAMASDTTPKYATGELTDLQGLGGQSVSGIAEMIPGEGANVQSFATLWKGIKSEAGRVADAYRKGKAGKWKEIDWSFLNPMEIRGGIDKIGRFNVGVKSQMGEGSKFGPQKIGEEVGQFTEDVGRSATWLRMVLNNAATPVEAAARTNAMHVDFRHLTNFERRFMRRVIPFYTYARRMSEFFIRDLMEHPGGRTANLIRAVNNSTGEGREDRIVPQQLTGQMVVPLYRNGKAQAYLRPDLPVDVLNDMFTIGPNSYSTIQNTVMGWLGQLHTIPKGILETTFGKSVFQKGRNLEDLYSRIGVKDPILNQIVMSSPLSRYISTYGPRGTLFDERKTAAEKLSSIVLGLPVTTIDMEKAAGEALNNAISTELRTEEGVARAERFYTYDESKVSERGKQLMDLQNEISNTRQRLRRKLKQDAERQAEAAQQQPTSGMPFNNLAR